MSERITAPVGRTASGRRAYTIAFRLEFCQAWQACTARGDKTRLLREYQLTRSTVVRWLDACHRGELSASMVEGSTRSKAGMDNRDRAELARLRAENQQLRVKVAQAQAAQEILGKAFGLLEQTVQSPDPAPQIPPALMSLDQYRQWLEGHKLS
ncbi:MAG: hypothetical protein SOH99_02395 [Acidipropionibacterium acidipropionici]|jgi:hypothetical protein|uniref:hypothetical protein n=1 Tax=Acidipropionibacterium acidipropionici TaxID=1748 RepID=UPI002F358B59